MTTTTPRLGITELEASQAVPETTVNEAQRFLEQGANFFIAKDKDTLAPPGSPADGDCYVIAGAGTGGWAGKDQKIAFRMSTGWLYITPIEGMLAYMQDENSRYVFDGSAWAVDGSGGANTTITTSEALSAGNVCNVYTSAGAARIRKANATDLTKPANAFVTAAAGSGSSATVFFTGQIITGLSALTPGTTYYLDTTGGAITDTPPSSSGNGVQQIGFALSATTLLFDPQPMIGL
jgi:hypothetical protein